MPRSCSLCAILAWINSPRGIACDEYGESIAAISPPASTYIVEHPQHKFVTRAQPTHTAAIPGCSSGRGVAALRKMINATSRYKWSDRTGSTPLRTFGRPQVSSKSRCIYRPQICSPSSPLCAACSQAPAALGKPPVAAPLPRTSWNSSSLLASRSRPAAAVASRTARLQALSMEQLGKERMDMVQTLDDLVFWLQIRGKTVSDLSPYKIAWAIENIKDVRTPHSGAGSTSGSGSDSSYSSDESDCEAGSLQLLLQAFMAKYPIMTAKQLARSITILARAGHLRGQALDSALGHLADAKGVQGVTINQLISIMPAAAKEAPRGVAAAGTLGFFRATCSRITAELNSSKSDLAWSGWELRSVLHACALVGFVDTQMCARVAAVTVAVLPKLEPRCIGLLLWSWATLRPCEQGGDELQKQQLQLFQEAAGVCLRHLHDGQFHPQGVSNILWAWATLDLLPSSLQAGSTEVSSTIELLDSLAEWSVANIGSFDPQALSNIAWACSKLRYRHDNLLDSIAAAVDPAQHGRYTPQGASNLLYAFAMLRPKQPLPEALLQLASQKARGMTMQGVCNCAWALTIAAAASSQAGFSLTAWQSLQPRLLEVLGSRRGLPAETALQLHQVQLAANLTGQQHILQLPADITKPTQAAISRNRAEIGGMRHSKFQADVYRTAKGLTSTARGTPAGGSILRAEFIDPLHPGPIDVAILWKSRAVAVQADGPCHYTSNLPHMALGSKVLRDWLLRELGWTVAVVPHWEWEAQNANSRVQEERQRRQYLQRLLDTSVAADAADAPEPRLTAGAVDRARALLMRAGGQ